MLFRSAGLTRQEITNQFEGYILSSGITEAGWSTPTLQEEGFLGSTVRAMRLWDMLCQRHLSKNETIVMVSHGDFVGHLLSFLFDTHPLFGEFFNMNNCAITTIHVDNAPKQPHLQEFNNTKHLLPRLITF